MHGRKTFGGSRLDEVQGIVETQGGIMKEVARLQNRVRGREKVG